MQRLLSCHAHGMGHGHKLCDHGMINQNLWYNNATSVRLGYVVLNKGLATNYGEGGCYKTGGRGM